MRILVSNFSTGAFVAFAQMVTTLRSLTKLPYHRQFYEF